MPEKVSEHQYFVKKNPERTKNYTWNHGTNECDALTQNRIFHNT